MNQVVLIKYRAFLSYSHHDEAWANWLHKSLERYRVDRGVVGRETSVGLIPSTVRPIFRDRDDFAGGSSLTKSTLQALTASEFLIIICSPHAAQSYHVNEEVRLFKAMGREARIIPVIVDGEPKSADRGCFPAALRFEVGNDGVISDTHAEPIAADARGLGDGREIAFQKIVAGLLGVGLDDIRKRAARAHQRRIAVLSLVAATMTFLAIAAGIAAWIARQRSVEAEQRLELALETAGAVTTKAVFFKNKFGVPVPVLSELLQQVEQLLGRLAAQGVSSSRLRLREAKLFDALADNNHSLGNTTKALEQAQQYANRLESLKSEVGGSFSSDNDLAWAYLKIGDLLRQRNATPAAKERFLAARKLLDATVAAEPGNLTWQSSLAGALGRLSDVSGSEGNLSEARRYADENVAIQRRLRAANPGNGYYLSSLASALNKRGVNGQISNDIVSAVTFFKASLDIEEQLEKVDPTNTEWIAQLAQSYQNVGYATERKGDLSGSIKYYTAALGKRRTLSDRDPSNASAQDSLAGALDVLGYLHQRLGHSSDALAAYNDESAIRRKLVTQDPANAEEKSKLALCLSHLAHIYAELGDLSKASAASEEALKLNGELVQSDPGNADHKALRVVSLGFVAAIRDES
jgi:eukaryotic-like serine/threonine-protein kinase